MRKRWIFIFAALALIVFIYFKFYRKVYDPRSVPGNADIVLSVDVKNTVRTAVGEFLSHPSRWRMPSEKTKKEISWRDVFKLPDFLCLFHIKGQDLGKWYVKVQIDKIKLFNEFIAVKHFQKQDLGNLVLYTSAELGLHFLRDGENVIISTYRCSREELTELHEQLFVKGAWMNPEMAKAYFVSGDHARLFIRNDNYFSSINLVKISVDGDRILINGELHPKAMPAGEILSSVDDKEEIFGMSVAPMPMEYVKLFPDSTKFKWSKTIGLPVDSVFLNTDYSWRFNLKGFTQRQDTAISYEYDENFNEVPKATVVYSTEPVMSLTATGKRAEQIMEMMRNREMIEQDGENYRFTGFPLWPLFAKAAGNNFSLQTSGYPADAVKPVKAIFDLSMHPSGVPDSLYKFIPDNIRPFFKTTRYLKINISTSSNGLMLEGEIRRVDGTYL
jgi:hypothetical protein